MAPGYVVVAHLRRGRRLDVYDLWSDERGCRCIGKTLRPERTDDETAAGQLRTEGLLLATLTHPHLVRGYETVLTAVRPRPAVVIETLPGQTVDYLIDRSGRLPPADAAMLGAQMCSVLGYLHRHGWVHLDVKPANIVEVGGRAVLLDLSVARRIGESDTGGTFNYLSPEQASGDAVTEAADVWGLGITLYEALAGATPWAHVPHRQRRSDGTRYYPSSKHQPLRYAPGDDCLRRCPERSTPASTATPLPAQRSPSSRLDSSPSPVRIHEHFDERASGRCTAVERTAPMMHGRVRTSS